MSTPKPVLERAHCAARKEANALKRGEVVTPAEDAPRVQLLDMGKGQPCYKTPALLCKRQTHHMHDSVNLQIDWPI